ncbi:hypothetical protein O181_001023 [Austropuccinia psidii MF-1]|uniref:Integrase catalytic domain-containing protein n=1 Tax=Austropuccinia psidii MF-1 TaxID=1389203 RepID=A0A9Q3B9Y6_9BASI|nr:hypothetical protein [Austropuccinia psidii MF-1]
MKVTSEGTLHLNTTTGKILIPNSLIVPSASSVLVSLGPFLKDGATLKGFKGGANLFDQNGNLILTTRIMNNVLLIDTPPSNVALSSVASLPLILHKSLGHPSNRITAKMWPNVNFSNLSCDSCSLGKSHRLSFSGTLPTPLNVLDVVHMDLCGPISPASRGGNHYIFQIIDGHSRMRFVYPFSTKSECFELFVKFQNLVENLKGRTIKTNVSDNGGGFVNSRFKHLFDVKGIQHLPTAPYTPQQNPVAGRGNQSLLERVQWDLSASLCLANLHPFGCTAIMNSPKPRQKSKVSPTGILCMLVGIQEGHHNYCLFDPKTNSIYISHDCIFKDKEAFWPSHSPYSPTLAQELFLLPSMPSFNPLPNVQESANDPDSVLFVPEENDSEGASAIPHAAPILDTTLPSPNLQLPIEADSSTPAFSGQPNSTSSLSRGNNDSLPKGWTCNIVPIEAPQNIDSSVLSSNILTSGRLRRPPSRFAGAVINKAPVSFKEAMASSKSDEREKTNSLGNVIERKACLCVRGFHQVENLDFHETFAPTGRLSTLLFLLGYCANHDFDLHQMDVKTAFLHGDLDENLFIRLPEGYDNPHSKSICLKLNKSLYGLKQGPRNWYLKIRKFFVEAGFCPSAADPCFFICNNPDPCFVFMHFDDLVIGGTNLNFFWSQISSVFDMKDLGDLCYVPGMKVTRNQVDRVIFLSQELYMNSLLDSFGMGSCKPASTPQVQSSRLVPRALTELQPATIHFRRAVGLLNYIVACTRPDPVYSASCLSQFLSLPSHDHELAFKHVLHYLKGTRTWGLWLGKIGDNSSITAYCDSDWGSNYDSRSFSGSCVFLYRLVGWKTTKQEVVALSSTEAEYRSISNCCQDVCWLLELVSDLGLSIKANLFCDNQGALAPLKNPLYQHRT